MKLFIKKTILMLLGISLVACTNSPMPNNVPPDLTQSQQDSEEIFNPELFKDYETPLYSEKDNEAFNILDYEIFLDVVTESEANANSLMADLSSYGLSSEEIDYGYGSGYSDQELALSYRASQDIYDQLISFDYTDLSRSQQDVYDTLVFLYEKDLQLNDIDQFNYYNQIFSDMSGVHTYLSSLLPDFVIENEYDLKVLLNILEDTPRFIDSALDYATKQIEHNTLITNADSIIEYCQTILDDSTQPLVGLLEEKINNLDFISNHSEVIDLIHTYYANIQSSYQKIIDFFTTNKDKINTQPIASLPNGQSYYQLLVQSIIGENLTIEEIKKYLGNQLIIYAVKAQLAMENYEDENLTFLNDTNILDFKSYEEIIEFALKQLPNYMPQIKEIDYQIANIPESLVTDGVLAYYLLPPLDNYQTQFMRVNPFNAHINSVSTYQTVNHEGYLGHMYQTTYLYENIKSNALKAYSIDASVEGYARYAEVLAIDYMPVWNDVEKEIYIYNELLNSIFTLLFDIRINFENLSLSEFTKTYSETIGVTFSEEELLPVYEQLRCNPGVFFAYEFGRLRILELKEYAQNTLGEQYDEVSFNTALMNAYHTPYATMKRHIYEYIQQAQ